MDEILFEALSEYFHALVLSSYFAKSMKITGSGREGLPKYNLEQMGFPLPPLTEQQRIVARIYVKESQHEAIGAEFLQRLCIQGL